VKKLALVAIPAVIAGLTLMPQASATPATPAPSADEPCAWWVETSLAKSNILYPDTAAAYWTMPYFTDSTSEITLQGTYLDARYFAVQAYDADAQLFTSADGVESAITDFDITPDAGSTNPYDVAGQPGGSWTVTMTDDPAATGPNVLPLSPATSSGSLLPGLPADTAFLMFRVYLPTGSFADVEPVLPVVTVTDEEGQSTTLTQCSNADRKALSKTATGASFIKALQDRQDPPAPSDQPELEFFRVGSAATPFPNADSAYIGALYTPKQGRIVVMRAEMPTTSTGTSPEVWTSGKQLRYWSICSYVYATPYPAVVVGSGSKKVTGCTNDTTTALNSRDQATVVVSFPADKKIIDRRLTKMKAATWLPMSPRYGTTQELLAVRNMLANPDYAQSATNIPTYADAAAAQQTMGTYYPQVGMCSVKTFLKSGVAGCLK